MTIEVQKTITITIDHKVFQVAEQSEEIKQMIVYLDEWRQNEADEAAGLLKTRAALRDLQNMILNQFKKEAEELVPPEGSVEEVVVEEIPATE